MLSIVSVAAVALQPSLAPAASGMAAGCMSGSSVSSPVSCDGALNRRALLGGLGAAASVALAPAAFALDSLIVDPNAARKADVGLLDEIPPGAKKAYLQYLPQLQLDADFYFFELGTYLDNPGRYDRISELTEAKTAGAGTTTSRMEREFVTPMKILSLAFPPDLGGEDMQTNLDVFQKSMFQLSAQARRGSSTGNTAGASSAEIKEIFKTYDTGRVALNNVFAALNEATGTSRLVAIPAAGNVKAYPRSKQLYTDLLKEAALCRNRGGEALAGLWGGLMVYGTVPGVNPCGNSALAYYSQGL